eukprot:COSAG03_NODE_2405_length_2806_cov_5.727004_4_plen_68_part_00
MRREGEGGGLPSSFLCPPYVALQRETAREEMEEKSPEQEAGEHLKQQERVVKANGQAGLPRTRRKGA